MKRLERLIENAEIDLQRLIQRKNGFQVKDLGEFHHVRPVRLGRNRSITSRDIQNRTGHRRRERNLRSIN